MTAFGGFATTVQIIRGVNTVGWLIAAGGGNGGAIITALGGGGGGFTGSDGLTVSNGGYGGTQTGGGLGGGLGQSGSGPYTLIPAYNGGAPGASAGRGGAGYFGGGGGGNAGGQGGGGGGSSYASGGIGTISLTGFNAPPSFVLSASGANMFDPDYITYATTTVDLKTACGGALSGYKGQGGGLVVIIPMSV